MMLKPTALVIEKTSLVSDTIETAPMLGGVFTTKGVSRFVAQCSCDAMSMHALHA